MVIFAFFFFSLLLAYLSISIVPERHVAIIQRFGRFHRTVPAGLCIVIPLVEQIRGYTQSKVFQLDVQIETKTEDNVFVHLTASVQYQIVEGKEYEAYYILADSERQIEAYVFDVVRAKVPHLRIDDLFSKKDEIAEGVARELREVMPNFGYAILRTLVTDIRPDDSVKKAMNEINAAQRLRLAAVEKGEAEKIIKVKQAEADAESKILQGQGMAGQRKAILDGLQASLDAFQEKISGSTTTEVMSLILMAQYFDTLKEMGSNGKLNTILVPHSPSALGDFYQQIREAIVVGHQMGKKDTT